MLERPDWTKMRVAVCLQKVWTINLRKGMLVQVKMTKQFKMPRLTCDGDGNHKFAMN